MLAQNPKIVVTAKEEVAREAPEVRYVPYPHPEDVRALVKHAYLAGIEAGFDVGYYKRPE